MQFATILYGCTDLAVVGESMDKHQRTIAKNSCFICVFIVFFLIFCKGNR